MPGLITEFLGEGLAAARPVTPDIPTGSVGFYYATDDNELSVYADGAWIENIVAGGGAASTTVQLTGTSTTAYATPDSVAALWEQGSDVASAGTISLDEGGYFNITGTTTITDIDFATDKAGRTAWVKFAGALTLTHNASTLILPTGANITTAAGDTACFVSEGADAVRCVAYSRASGRSVKGSTLYTDVSQAGTSTSTSEQDLATYTLPGGTLHTDGMGVRITAWGTLAATTRSRTVSLYFGATKNPTYTSTSASAVQWRSQVVVLRSGATTQTGSAQSGMGQSGSNEDLVYRSRAFSPGETLSGDVVIKMTGQVGGSPVANDITCDGFLVELIA